MNEDIIKVTGKLAEVVIHILFLKSDTFQQVMTLLGYTIVAIVRAVAKTQQHDPDKEMAKFIDYLTDVYAQQKQAQPSEQKTKVINLN